MTQSYNGWPNRSTWNVMLWMDNDEPCYHYYVEAFQRMKAKGKRAGGVFAKHVCKNALGDRTPDGISLDSSHIRWGKIAESMRESV